MCFIYKSLFYIWKFLNAIELSHHLWCVVCTSILCNLPCHFLHPVHRAIKFPISRCIALSRQVSSKLIISLSRMHLESLHNKKKAHKRLRCFLYLFYLLSAKCCRQDSQYRHPQFNSCRGSRRILSQKGHIKESKL